ncbi:DUF757-domain-containing protein [Cystobasidium minutum MCA 4210]|uniref:DUF757-domain-containing protein n=1 Tax=Cystobasidium minutum MCA 4210 TaxID=1397322 RepID=UPI0034CD5F9C|eukprot:jgi/Rhomi1/173963/fgenesh1_kg.7_\
MQMIPKGFDAANAPNNEEIEKQFAVACMDHAEAYWKLLTSIKPGSLKLTPHDDKLSADFLHHFPEFDDNARLSKVTDDDLKTAAAKHKWRTFMKEWEKDVEDYNFGTLLRSDCTDEYTESNSIFVLRIQFLVFEILRNRRGLNDAVYEKAKQSK